MTIDSSMKVRTVFLRFTAIICLTLYAIFPARVSAGEYWQQQADYVIDVTLSVDGRTISGSQVLTYTNNSPDTLDKLYLKAFANSARKGSLMDQQNRRWENYSLARADSSQWGYSRISNVKGRGNRELKYRLDDTIYEILLEHAIAPGEIARIALDFETRLPEGIGDRHEYVGGQSKAAYWYPQVCVYDRKMGWVNAPYVGRGECYGDFGDFEVSITAPEDQVVVATGLLANRPEVLPDTLREMLDITNFLEPSTEWPEFEFDSTKTKTWKFFAKKVNDFAWVSSANFCIDEGMSNGIQIECYAQKSNAKGWVRAVEYAARSEETFSELYGAYGWPAIKVTDSYDGMEYPMLTFCSGGDPGPSFPWLIYHEIGHFWFMGLVGSNQVDRACLDEGFTTMAEIVAAEKYHGRKGNNVNWSSNWYKRNFFPLDEDRDARGYRIYLQWVRSGYDLPMVIPSDNTTEYWAYRNSSYYKPVMMHFTLRSTYVDKKYFEAMRRYGTRWFFRHPYEEDFIESFSNSVDENLEEYFAQWYRSRRRVDYAFEGKKHISDEKYEITLSKPGDFVTPIDVALIDNHSDTTFYTVNPEGHFYIKPGYNDGGTWPQYRVASKKYTFEAIVPGKINKVVVDPNNLLPDIHRLNNASGFFPPIETKFDAMIYDIPSMHKYSLRLRPDFWYDRPNGLIVGGHAHGSYIKKEYKFSLDAGIGTESKRALIDLELSHPFAPFGKSSFIDGRLLHSDFRTYAKVGLRKEYRPRWTGPDFLSLELSGNYLNIPGGAFGSDFSTVLDGIVRDSRELFLNSDQWSERDLSWAEFKSRYVVENRIVDFWGVNTLRANFGLTDRRVTSGQTHIELKNSVDLKLTSTFKLTIGHRWFRTWGVSRTQPYPFEFNLKKATPFDEFASSQIFRSPGSFPTGWMEDFYLDVGGIRGYAPSDLNSIQGNLVTLKFSGIPLIRNLWPSRNTFLERFIAGFDTQLFFQIARYHRKTITICTSCTFPSAPITLATYQLQTLSTAGASFTSPSIWNGQKIRFDFPVYLSQPDAGEEKFDFRFSAAWILPINTERWSR